MNPCICYVEQEVEDSAPDASTKADEGITREGAIKKEHVSEFYDGPRDHDKITRTSEDDMVESIQEPTVEEFVSTQVVMPEIDEETELHQEEDMAEQSNGEGDNDMVEAEEGDEADDSAEQMGSNTME